MTRQEEQLDPEAEADFDRAFESMMSESMQSRKSERKPMFDVPLPMRRAPNRENNLYDENENIPTPAEPPKTMAFSLMTKRGNRQQVGYRCFLLLFSTDLPDSDDRSSLGFQFCCCHEESAAGRARRTAAH